MPYKEHKQKKRMMINEDPKDQVLADTIDNWVEDVKALGS